MGDTEGENDESLSKEKMLSHLGGSYPLVAREMSFSRNTIRKYLCCIDEVSIEIDYASLDIYCDESMRFNP
jgi:hypothetical protein